MASPLHSRSPTEDYDEISVDVDLDDGEYDDLQIDVADECQDGVVCGMIMDEVTEKVVIEKVNPVEVDPHDVILLDRRVHPRIPVSMRVIELDGDVLCYQRAGNLSEGGLFIEGGLRPIGKKFTLMFVPPGSSTRIVTRALVVGRIAGRRTGTCVRFLEDGTSEVRCWLRRYVHQQLS